MATRLEEAAAVYQKARAELAPVLKAYHEALANLREAFAAEESQKDAA
jgi:hypothetical protein